MSARGAATRIEFQKPRTFRKFVDARGGEHDIEFYIVVNGVRLGIVTLAPDRVIHTARWTINAHNITRFTELPNEYSSPLLQTVRSSVRRRINKLVGDAHKLYLKGR